MPKLDLGNGIEIFYEEVGSGDRYLLCTQVGHSNYGIERELAKRGYHVFLLTNRGFGRSTHVTEDYGDHWYDMFAEDVVSFADKMGIGKFIYCGSSHGAGSGWHLVLNHPERVSAFIAIVAGPHNIDESKVSVRSAGMKNPVHHVFHVDTDDERLNERRRLMREYDMAQRAQPDYEEVFNAPEVRAIDYRRPLVKYGTEAEVQKALSTIETPVLLMGGMEDTIGRPDLMMRTAKCLKKCKCIMYSQFGHGIDIFEELAREADTFIRNLEATGYYYDEVRN